ncbi:MAG: cation-efflux pump [Anaerolineae bacterium]|nr:cation-efflux pump [Anaerolineae bacterium]
MENLPAIRRVLWITMALNLLATLAKLGVGYWTASLSLIADGFDSAFDSATNIIGLVGVSLAARPADRDHPYGHRKAETMTAMVIACLLFLTTWELIKSAIERLRDPSLITVEVNVWSFAALVVSILVHMTVVWYELRAGRRLQSDVLIADALHTRADVFVSLSVMGGLIAVRLGYPLADPILALVVALLIAKIGVDIIRESSPTLMDHVMVPADQVEQIALSVPGVVSCHRVRSRGHEGAVYADLHIHVSPAMSTEQAHAIAHEVQHRLTRERPDVRDVTIHVEPAGTPPAGQNWQDVAAQLRRLAAGLGMSIHNIWISEVKGELSVDVHLEADETLSLREAHALASSLEERALGEIPNLVSLTTHLEPQGQLTSAADTASAEPGVRQIVEEAIHNALEEQGSYTRLQVRQGEKGWVVTLTWQLPADLSLAEAHELSSRLESRLRGEFPDLERVTIHTEPAG